MLKALRESPRLFYYRYVARESPPKSGDALAYGTLLHTWAELGESEFWPLVARPADTLVTAAGALSAKGKEWAAGLAPGQIPLAPADEAKLRPQTQRLLDNPVVAEIIADTQDREFNVRWSWHGHQCRARMDGRTSRFLFDWKTTRDENPSRESWRSAMHFGYHLQSAMYQYAGALAGYPDEPMRFIFTSTVHPYDCCVRWLPPQVIEHGRKECIRLLEELQSRIDFNMWDRLDSHTACELEFPAYAMRDFK